MTSSPYINRFIQPDSIIPNPASPQSWNRFSYVLNNPINASDPSGHKCNGEPDECLQDDESTGSGFLGNPHEPDARDCGGNFPVNCDGSPKLSINMPEKDPTKKERPFDDLKFWVDSYAWAKWLDDAATFVINNERPVWRHTKGVIPGGLLEFWLGAISQGINDLDNPSLTIGKRIGRALVIGGEDLLADAGSNVVAAFLAPLGFEVGAGAGAAFATPETAGLGTLPGGLAGGIIGGGVTYFAASYYTTQAIDFVFEEINPSLFPKLFP